jgi:hypothetical protein
MVPLFPAILGIASTKGLSKMTKVDDGFTGRVLIALVTELVDRNYEDAKVLVQTLANEHGVGTYAERVFAQEVR